MPIHDGRIFGPMADGLAKDSADHTVGRPLHQLPGKAAADAVADEEELLDPEVVHQAELVVGECVPWVAGGIGPVDSPPLALRWSIVMQ